MLIGDEIMGNFRDAFSGFGRELLDEMRDSAQQHIEDAAFEERVIGIENAVSAMLECKVKEDKIIQMLQKYWDLRLSEAKMFVEHQKDAE